jgi:Short C-terminal domain
MIGEAFGLFSLVGDVAAIVGPLMLGLVTFLFLKLGQEMLGYRVAILALVGLLCAGWILLRRASDSVARYEPGESVEQPLLTAGPSVAGVEQMWAMAVGGGVLGLIGLVLRMTEGTAGLGSIIWLCGIALILKTAYDLARYKGRRHWLWIVLAFFFGWLALIVLALLPNLRVDAKAAPTVRSNVLDGQLAHLAELHAAGVLSAEEFAQAKERLLAP